MRSDHKLLAEGYPAIWTDPEKKVRKPPICEGCGKNPSDPPSKLCVGCQAYQDHQR